MDPQNRPVHIRVRIALALLPDPDLLILDEPTHGLDPQGIVEIRSLLMRLGARGKIVFVSSHLLAEIQAACDSIVMVDHGGVVFSGSMTRAFTSEWVKLSRRTTLVGFGGTMIAFTLLFTILAFEGAGGRSIDLDGSGSETSATTAMLSTSEGSVFVVTDVAAFFGIVALALFASNLAGELHRGTIRLLFVTEPNRLEVLAGKLVALTSFVAAAVAATLAISIGAGALMASRVGVETAAWWTTDGLSAIGTAYLNLTAAALVPALIGAMIAVLTRSTTLAISVGLGWFILAETLLGAFWNGLSRWGPAATSNAIATGGTVGVGMMGGTAPDISYATATLLAISYSLAALMITSTVLAKRDVTS